MPKILDQFPQAVAFALKKELGATHQAAKIIMRWTGAGERTVKNWLSGTSAPSGQYLVDLMRHSDGVLEVILVLAGRPHIVAAQKLAEVKSEIEATVKLIDSVLEEGHLAS
jgi:hypothetical protein